MATKPDPGPGAGVYGFLHLGAVHDLEVVRVITASIQSSLAAPKRQSSMLVWVLKPTNLILPACFISAAQSLMAGVISSMPVRAGEKKRSRIARLQPFQTLVQPFGKIAALGLKLGDQEDLLAGFGVAGEKAADALLAQGIAVVLGRVLEGDAPFHRLLQEQLVVDGIDHAAQVKDGNVHPGLAQSAFGHGVDLDRRGRRLRGRRWPR